MARELDGGEHRRAILRGNAVVIGGILQRDGHDDASIAAMLIRDGLDGDWWLRWSAGDAQGDAYG
jgi:hypothetical protein